MQKVKSKFVLVHNIKEYGGERRHIFILRHEMEVIGQLHAPVALTHEEILCNPLNKIVGEPESVRMFWMENKSHASNGNRTTISQTSQV